MQRLVLAAATVLACTPARAGFDLPHCAVPRVETPLVLDGKGGDARWESGAKLLLSDFIGDPQDAPQRTRVSVLHDAKCLFIAFDCEDSDVRAVRTEHEDQTFRDDSVEIYLGAPHEQLADAVGLEINALGTCADFYYRHADWINFSWEPRLEIKVSRIPQAGFKGYRVEVAIPFSELLPALQLGPELPQKLRANFSRWDRGQTSRFTIWSDPQLSFPHPHKPDRYGWLDLQ